MTNDNPKRYAVVGAAAANGEMVDTKNGKVAVAAWLIVDINEAPYPTEWLNTDNAEEIAESYIRTAVVPGVFNAEAGEVVPVWAL